VKINDLRVDFIEWEINNNGFYQADTFLCTMPLKQSGPIDLTWWAQVTYIIIEIYAGYPNNPASFSESDLDLLIKAEIDDLTIDPTRSTVKLSGRDYTALLIDTKTSKKWLNQTSSQIATFLADSHDLTPVVTKTSTKVGRYYELEHAKITTFRSEWNLLSYLASLENFNVYVKGDELHFEPKSDGADYYLLKWDDVSNAYPTFTGSHFHFSRNMNLSKDSIVYVHSWNQKHKKGFTKIARASHKRDPVLKRANTPLGSPQSYYFCLPNLTPDQAQQEAYARLRAISAHEMKLFATLPADNILTPRTVIRLEGTGLYDQDYYADSIIRYFSASMGYKMEITAKNHNTDSVII